MQKNSEDEKFSEKRLGGREIYKSRMLKYDIDEVLLPNGRKALREVIRHPGAAAVTAVLPDGKIVLVRQYRYPVGRVLYELPAGKLNAGEDPLACARRELAEETGFTAEQWRKLSSIVTAPGFCDEVIHIYRADGLSAGRPRTDEDEFVETVCLTPQEIGNLIRNGGICDAKTLAGLFLCEILK
ncbi:MAG: NUDIX hydrolase [Acidaminococcales bacterium]|jgi:ADP-ribose pyrophosphatase|nr:NUDIX hydrolase [Acidaminococcales bacterium]